MTDTIIVANRAHTPLRITEPLPEQFKDKPGDAPVLKTAMLNGNTHASAVNGAGVTRGVDAALFRSWYDAAKKSGSPLADMVSEVSEDDVKDQPVSYGFEPGLKTLADDATNTEKLQAGSTVQEPGPVSSSDMKPTTVIPDALHATPPDQIENDMTHPAKLD